MLKKQLSVLYLFLASSTFHLASSLFLHAELHEEGNQSERGERESMMAGVPFQLLLSVWGSKVYRGFNFTFPQPIRAQQRLLANFRTLAN